MWQEILVWICFAVAAGYLVRLFTVPFSKKNEGPVCAKGCGGCSKIDIEKIAEELRKSQALQK